MDRVVAVAYLFEIGAAQEASPSVAALRLGAGIHFVHEFAEAGGELRGVLESHRHGGSGEHQTAIAGRVPQADNIAERGQQIFCEMQSGALLEGIEELGAKFLHGAGFDEFQGLQELLEDLQGVGAHRHCQAGVTGDQSEFIGAQRPFADEAEQALERAITGGLGARGISVTVKARFREDGSDLVEAQWTEEGALHFSLQIGGLLFPSVHSEHEWEYLLDIDPGAEGWPLDADFVAQGCQARVLVEAVHAAQSGEDRWCLAFADGEHQVTIYDGPQGRWSALGEGQGAESMSAEGGWCAVGGAVKAPAVFIEDGLHHSHPAFDGSGRLDSYLGHQTSPELGGQLRRHDIRKVQASRATNDLEAEVEEFDAAVGIFSELTLDHAACRLLQLADQGAHLRLGHQEFGLIAALGVRLCFAEPLHEGDGVFWCGPEDRRVFGEGRHSQGRRNPQGSEDHEDHCQKDFHEGCHAYVLCSGVGD